MDVAFFRDNANFIYEIVEYFANQMILDNQKIDAALGYYQ